MKTGTKSCQIMLAMLSALLLQSENSFASDEVLEEVIVDQGFCIIKSYFEPLTEVEVFTSRVENVRNFTVDYAGSSSAQTPIDPGHLRIRFEPDFGELAWDHVVTLPYGPANDYNSPTASGSFTLGSTNSGNLASGLLVIRIKRSCYKVDVPICRVVAQRETGPSFTAILHPGEYGNIVEANLNGNYVLEFVNEGELPELSVNSTNLCYVFAGWNPVLPDTVSSNFESTAVFEKICIDADDDSIPDKWSHVTYVEKTDGDGCNIVVSGIDGRDKVYLTDCSGLSDGFNDNVHPIYLKHPDGGGRIIFASNRYSGIGYDWYDLFSVCSDGPDLRRITSDYQRHWYFCEDSDNGKVYFLSGGSALRCDRMAPDATGFENLAAWGAAIHPLDVCAGKLLFTTDHTELKTINLDGTGYQIMASGDGRSWRKGAFNPQNGSEVIATALNDGVVELWLLDLNAGSKTEVEVADMTFAEYVRFTPDGEKLIFSGKKSGESYTDIFVSNLDGSDLINITETADVSEVEPFAFSPRSNTGYDTWAENNLPWGERKTADVPVSDGIPNLIKYACGLPVDSLCSASDYMAITNASDDAFTVDYLIDPEVTDVLLQPLFTSELGSANWTPVDNVNIGFVKTENDGRDRYRVTIPRTDKGFVKLQADFVE